MKEPTCVVTAVNRLTRKREAVTPPCSRQNAQKILTKEIAKVPAKRAWLRPRIEITPKQLSLNFKD